jgi:hypothetical protein
MSSFLEKRKEMKTLSRLQGLTKNKGGDKKNEKTMIYSIDSTLSRRGMVEPSPFPGYKYQKIKEIKN